MSNHVGDKAAEVAEQLRADHEAALKLKPEDEVLGKDEPSNVMMTRKQGMFSKVEFAWRDSDQRTLDQIRAAVGSMFMGLFDDAITLLDNLYCQLRTPRVNAHGVPMVGADGRYVWETDDKGEPVERWENLTGEDIEHCLFDLARLRMSVAPKINELLMEAMFAKRIQVDAYDDAYGSMLDGTVSDKTASANRKSRQDNYHAFFRYWLWSQGDTFLKELANFQRLLERTRDWNVRSQWR